VPSIGPTRNVRVVAVVVVVPRVAVVPIVRVAVVITVGSAVPVVAAPVSPRIVPPVVAGTLPLMVYVPTSTVRISISRPSSPSPVSAVVIRPLRCRLRSRTPPSELVQNLPSRVSRTVHGTWKRRRTRPSLTSIHSILVAVSVSGAVIGIAAGRAVRSTTILGDAVRVLAPVLCGLRRRPRSWRRTGRVQPFPIPALLFIQQPLLLHPFFGLLLLLVLLQCELPLLLLDEALGHAPRRILRFQHEPPQLRRHRARFLPEEPRQRDLRLLRVDDVPRFVDDAPHAGAGVLSRFGQEQIENGAGDDLVLKSKGLSDALVDPRRHHRTVYLADVDGLREVGRELGLLARLGVGPAVHDGRRPLDDGHLLCLSLDS
jgi:hypothetical protein